MSGILRSLSAQVAADAHAVDQAGAKLEATAQAADRLMDPTIGALREQLYAAEMRFQHLLADQERRLAEVRGAWVCALLLMSGVSGVLGWALGLWLGPRL